MSEWIGKWITPNGLVTPEVKRYKPKPHDIFWTVSDSGEVKKYFSISGIDKKQYNFGNCFKTKKQALEAVRRLRETLLNYHKELQNDQMES